ncbi:MAG: SMP-30/gluconolactonase/LRE family protein [Actinomycetota bacterium]
MRGISWSALGLAALVTVGGCSPESASGPVENLAGQISVAAIVDGAGTIDAVPSPDGTTTYFTVSGPAGIFRTTGNPDGPVRIDSGTGITSPRGLTVSSDGKLLFVADAGSIVSVPVEGGQPTQIAGTRGTSARGIDVIGFQGADALYFTGKDPADGLPAVMRIPAEGGTRTVVAKGGPLAEPDGLVVSSTGVIYLTDRGDAGAGAAVYRIESGVAERLARLRLGDPAGVALTLDGSKLLVSSLAEAGTAQLFVIDLANLRTGVVDRVIGLNRSAGGLHRARDAATFAWADVQRPGRIYRIDP